MTDADEDRADVVACPQHDPDLFVMSDNILRLRALRWLLRLRG